MRKKSCEGGKNKYREGRDKREGRNNREERVVEGEGRKIKGKREGITEGEGRKARGEDWEYNVIR